MCAIRSQFPMHSNSTSCTISPPIYQGATAPPTLKSNTTHEALVRSCFCITKARYVDPIHTGCATMCHRSHSAHSRLVASGYKYAQSLDTCLMFCVYLSYICNCWTGWPCNVIHINYFCTCVLRDLNIIYLKRYTSAVRHIWFN